MTFLFAVVVTDLLYKCQDERP